jgi:protein TonB
MASKKAKLPREDKQSSATVIPFPVVPRREEEIAAEIPFPVVPRRQAETVSSKAAPKPAGNDDRPTLPELKRARWWEVALLASLLIHALAVLAFSLKYSYDMERAAGAASAASTDGALVIPIEVVVTAALPSAEKPTDATAPDATKPAQTTPKDEQKAKEKTETAPPQKSDAAQEVVPTAKDSPSPEKREREQKKKETAQASRSAATSPNQAAASRSEGRAGAGGHSEFGGTANISSYQAQVLAHLQRFRVYPPEAKNAGIRGTATVRFSLASSGSVISSSLSGGSGSSVLDQAALAMVRRASPFPAIPPSLGRSHMDFAAPVRFDLR